MNALPFDPEFTQGAHNAVHVCLRIQPEEKVTLITDQACLEIAASIAAELDQLGSPYNTFVLEELAVRPLIDMPQPVLDDMETSQVSIFAVVAQKNELRTRMQMDGRRESTQDAARPHGEHRAAHHARRDARGFQ